MSEPTSHTPATAPGGDPPAPDNRQQAADVTRHQIEQIYRQNAPNQLQPVQREAVQPTGVPERASPYNRTHQEGFDWRDYHSAWQTYYQEYYRRYYTHQNAKKSFEQKPPAEAV